MSLTVYHYAKCSTCKKAIKWLDARGLEYKLIDIVEKPPSKSALKKIAKAADLPPTKLFNTSGMSYRSGNFKEKSKSMSADEIFTALAADGKLIKRPLVSGDGVALVGFKEPTYEDALG
ncbi:MAG: arsenate reductase family protein [Myxococcota bacterium]